MVYHFDRKMGISIIVLFLCCMSFCDGQVTTTREQTSTTPMVTTLVPSQYMIAEGGVEVELDAVISTTAIFDEDEFRRVMADAANIWCTQDSDSCEIVDPVIVHANDVVVYETRECPDIGSDCVNDDNIVVGFYITKPTASHEVLMTSEQLEAMLRTYEVEIEVELGYGLSTRVTNDIITITSTDMTPIDTTDMTTLMPREQTYTTLRVTTLKAREPSQDRMEEGGVQVELDAVIYHRLRTILCCIWFDEDEFRRVMADFVDIYEIAGPVHANDVVVYETSECSDTDCDCVDDGNIVVGFYITKPTASHEVLMTTEQLEAMLRTYEDEIEAQLGYGIVPPKEVEVEDDDSARDSALPWAIVVICFLNICFIVLIIILMVRYCRKKGLVNKVEYANDKDGTLSVGHDAMNTSTENYGYA